MTRFSIILLLHFLIFSVKAKDKAPAHNYNIQGTPINQVCVGSSSLLNDIVINENLADDINISGSGTIILKASSGVFVSGGESVTFTGSPFVNANISVTSTQVIITLTETNNDNDAEVNSLTIHGLHIMMGIATEANIALDPTSTISISGMSPGSTVSNINSNNKPAGLNDALTACSYNALSYNLQNNINALGNGVQSNFQWSVSDNPAVTGESTGLNAGNFISDVLENISGTSQDVIYTATPTSQGGGCAGNSFTITVTVNPAPVLTVVNSAQVIPSGGTTNITISSSLAGTTINFSASLPPGISGPTEGSGNFIGHTLTNSGGPSLPVEYTITGSSANSCQSLNVKTIVKVNGFPSVSVSDSLALVAIYNATNGPGWKTQWLNDAVSNWYGVAVSGLRVTGINLIGNDISGTLPAQIGDLTALTSLALTGDKGVGLSGPLPSQMGALIALTSLDLSGNLFTTFPTVLLNLTSLTNLSLAQNQMSGTIPVGSGNLVNLNGLNLSYNQFSGTVPNLSGFSPTIIINLSHNNFTSIPDPSSWSFTLMDLSENLFTFEDIEPIKSNPKISYVPQKPFPGGGIRNLGSGDTFTASFTVGGSANLYSWFKGESIPGQNSNSITISNISPANSGIYSLHVSNTLVPSLILSSDPITLNVSPNYTVDSLAAVALYNSTSGAGWVNQTNWLTGTLDTWHGLSVNGGRITAIDLSDNKLKGTIPAALGTLVELAYLDLGGKVADSKSTDPNRNSISGTIPSTLGNLTKLYYLNLSSNDLTGTLPASFSNLLLLKQFWLTGNNLNLGSFPTAILSMTALQSLKLSASGITGIIPPAIGGLNSLQSLILNNNKIASIPNEITNLSGLQLLYLNNNLISDLPNIKLLSALSDVHVEGNKLTFEDLEPNMGVGSFVYAPQDSVGTKSQVLIRTGTPYTLTSSIGGTANQYQWKKNNVAISGATSSSYTLSAPNFVDDGKYAIEATSSIVPGLTIFGRSVQVSVSSLKRDSLALIAMYNATKGGSWTNKTGWITGNLSTWNGVTITGNSVVGINLVNNNLDGIIPSDIDDMLNLKTIKIANNKITAIPAFSALTQLTSVDVSGNKLDFGSLESNVSILGIMNYSNQADIGAVIQDSVDVASPYLLSVTTAGVNNVYQWKRNNTAVADAINSSYAIASLDKTNMGKYICEITNTVVPGLQLKTSPQNVLAVTELSGTLFSAIASPATKGNVTLFRITPDHGYDTISVQHVGNNGSYKFRKVVLDDYQIMGFADNATYAGALPTYYKKTIFWEEADRLSVVGSKSDLDIVSVFKPATAPISQGIIKGFVEQDIAGPGGRVMSKPRVSEAGVCARRVENTGRSEQEILTLVSFVFTNQNGEFEIDNLPEGNYRLNIQYPGYPMDETSFTTIPVGTGFKAEVQVEATVTATNIVVRQLAVTGIAPKESYAAEIYPIPSSDFIVIQFGTTSGSRTVEMMDLAGRRIMKADAREKQISLNVRSVQGGVYLLDIKDKNNSVKKLRVVVQ